MTAIDEHLAWCARNGLRPTYLASIRGTLLRIERQIGPLETATEADIDAWWANLTIGSGKTAYAAHITGFYRWLIWERRRNDDPTTRLIRPKQRQRLPRPIPDARLRTALLGSVPPVRTWLLLAAYEGMRACEIAILHRNDISPTNIVVHGKGDKERSVPMNREVEIALTAHPADGYLFPGRRGHEHVLANSVSQRANRHLREIGIDDTLHSLRHWFGTTMYRASKDIRMTQDLMGHSSPATTALYTKWESEEAVALVSMLTVGTADEHEPAA